MRRHREKSDSKVMSEINITPFTDVVLVLLIIFMITSPVIISGGLNIKLPYSSSSERVVNDRIEIALNSKKEILYNNTVVSEEVLVQKLKSLLGNKTHSEVILKADYRLTHGWVVHIIDIIKSAGADKILIGTANEEVL